MSPSRKPRRVDHAALGYRLTAADVAAILEVDEHAVVDYVRASGLPVLISGDGAFGPLRMTFQHDDVVVLAEQLAEQRVHADVRNRARVQAALRAYLEQVPSVRDYDRALLANAPLWVRTRADVALAVRAEAVALHHNVSVGAVPLTVSMVSAALGYLRAVRVRGVVAAESDGRQRWSTWWRLPPGFAPGATEDERAVGLLTGAVEPGEKVVRRGRGPAVLADPLSPADGEFD